MRRWMKWSIVMVMTFSLLYFLSAFLLQFIHLSDEAEIYNEEDFNNPLNNITIQDNNQLYDHVQKKADPIYITLYSSNGLEDENDGLSTLEEMEQLYEKDKDMDVQVEIYFEDKTQGIYQNSTLFREPNGTIRLRGSESTKILQKSYRINLYDKAGLWNGQNVINLNKHYRDTMRIRNKLSFDYLSIIPNITSLRTRFVRLFVKDLSLNEGKDGFIDYGLYTQVEQPNKLFLQNHGLDPNGFLYKAENFNFSRNESYLKEKNDQGYSKNKFEEILDIRGNDDHSKLINMLEDVNDSTKDINDIVDKHFDRDNYLTWVAVNILFDNYKTSNTNFILYSPINSDKWFFMPWDYDDAWSIEDNNRNNRPPWQKGLAMYWDNPLHRKFFEDPNNVQQLSHKIDELKKIINEEQTREFIDRYYNLVLYNITQLPDIQYLVATLDQIKEEYNRLPSLTEKNRLYYYELLEKPMPYSLNEPVQYPGQSIVFSWEPSFDIQMETISYKLEISKDKMFDEPIKVVDSIKETSYTIEGLEEGVYYWRVVAMDEKGNKEISFDVYEDPFGDEFYGIKKLEMQ